MTNRNGRTGRRPSKLSVALQNLATAFHCFLYRSTNGAIGGTLAGYPVLLLTTRGRRTGKPRTVPLLYVMDGPNAVLIASNGGAAKHPTWFLNLQNTPEARMQIKGVQRQVRAELASAVEKPRLWGRMTAMYPSYNDYQAKTDRDIPVVILRPSLPGDPR